MLLLHSIMHTSFRLFNTKGTTYCFCYTAELVFAIEFEPPQLTRKGDGVHLFTTGVMAHLVMY